MNTRKGFARRLIVTADDFGRTSGINRGVVEAHHHGVVTSASLMVVGRAAAEAALLSRDLPALGVGLHVVLSGGEPVMPARDIPTLVGSSARFPRAPDDLSSARYRDVLAEVRAQYERFLSLMGRPATHIDTHHHAHRVQVVFEAIVELGREQGLPIRAVSPAMRAHLREHGLMTTDDFIDSFHGDGVSVELLKKVIGALRVNVSELMSHPGYVDDELRRESRYAQARERELAVMTDPAVRAAVRACGVRLIHYGDISRARARTS